jgi:NAD(P)-dependent dehydrogenase (short-subunit alcohol dehydrogenase family)
MKTKPAHTKPLVVVITGASAGVGRAAARRFAEDGASVALLARGEEGLEAARQEVEACGGRALVCAVDVADATAVLAAAERIERELGPIDVWVNNAMVSVYAPFDQIAPDEFRRVTEVTYLGFVYGTMAALKVMKPRDRGVIVQVGSALAYRSIPLQSAYCGAKHAIKGFTASLRSELMHDRSQVHVCMVQLPAMNTPQFEWTLNRMGEEAQPVPPIFQPEVGAEAIHWMAHHRRREIFVGGPTVKAILGNRVIPGLLDRYLAGAAYDGQTTGRRRPPGRPNNLWQPVPGDHGAHGRFDDRSTDRSWQLEAAKHRDALLAVGLIAGAVAASWWWRSTRHSGESPYRRTTWSLAEQALHEDAKADATGAPAASLSRH